MKSCQGSTRHIGLKLLLESRRREIETSVRGVLSTVREQRAATDHVAALDDSEVPDLDVQEDIELALVEIKVETLARIDAALERLASGAYGTCAACGDDISTARLQALPFAIRCVDCEATREADARRRHHHERGVAPLVAMPGRLK